ncbi:MAG: hypothetical protein H7A23_24415 [Leptospiraceae bacterium]|nr:hypothetical protein [Leptospiraceae bacterium]MCP5497710.1 hypothetical protein [Leptospiraceae bacterium]
MNEELEIRLLKEIEELKREIKELKAEEDAKIPIYQYSKIRDMDLENMFDISQKIDRKKFDSWFNNNIKTGSEDENFLFKLLEEESDYIAFYGEEDLKMRFLSPLLRKIDFKTENFRDFYNERLVYQTDKFILNGEVDFVISTGLKRAKEPYFFIQEFKRGKENSNPEPQLLAELISAVELNNFQTIRGAYIIGAIWNFVILERLEKHRYIYFVSANFDSTKMEDLRGIYKNLLFVKEEITKMVRSKFSK